MQNCEHHLQHIQLLRKRKKKQDDADDDPAVDGEDDDDDGPGEEVINAAEADGSEDVVNLITSELTFVIEETVLTQRRQRVKGPGTIKQQREALLFQTHKFQLPEIP